MRLMDYKPTVPEVLPAVNDYYLRRRDGGCPNGNGGSLHIILEDGNVRDGHVRSCLQNAADRQDLEGFVLALVLLEMSPTQRLKLQHHKYPEHADYQLAKAEAAA